jgi:hypothetical protein
MCNCVKDFKSKKRKSWEGPINLRNLSRIELGCFVFEFIILKTDAISNNIDNRNVVKQKFSTCNSSSIFPFKSMKFNDIFAHEKYQVESRYEEILQRKEILKRLKLMRKSFKRFDNKRLEKVLIKNKNHVKVLLKLSNSNQNKKSLLWHWLKASQNKSAFWDSNKIWIIWFNNFYIFIFYTKLIFIYKKKEYCPYFDWLNKTKNRSILSTLNYVWFLLLCSTFWWKKFII